MKNLSITALLVLGLSFSYAHANAQEASGSFEVNAELAEQLKAYSAFIDSVEKTLNYQTGEITIGNIGKLKLSDKFKYLDGPQAERVLTELWGNLASSAPSLGMIVPAGQSVIGYGTWAYNLTYDAIGYVKDKDADKMDYDDLAKTIRESTREESAERIKMGRTPFEFIGFATTPFYDKERKVLYWAKEYKFEGEDEEDHSINYNFRILGRKGVFEINAIATVSELEDLEEEKAEIVNAFQFNEDLAYAAFNPGIDEVAAYTIGGLIAGKILAKAGFFAVLLKFWKFIALGFVALGSFLFKRFRNKKEAESELPEAGNA